MCYPVESCDALLGEETSSSLLQHLSEDEVQKVSREVAKLTAISAEQAEGVLQEFHHIARHLFLGRNRPVRVCHQSIRCERRRQANFVVKSGSAC